MIHEPDFWEKFRKKRRKWFDYIYQKCNVKQHNILTDSGHWTPTKNWILIIFQFFLLFGTFPLYIIFITHHIRLAYHQKRQDEEIQKDHRHSPISWFSSSRPVNLPKPKPNYNPPQPWPMKEILYLRSVGIIACTRLLGSQRIQQCTGLSICLPSQVYSAFSVIRLKHWFGTLGQRLYWTFSG